MKTSLVLTVLNEQNSIVRFIQSVISQTKLPDEVIIVDGGSTDSTILLAEKFISDKLRKDGVVLPFKVVKKKGNRSLGRNEGVKNAKYEIILFSDAGCELHKDWVKEIQVPFSGKNIDVVAGYYEGRSETVFEKCLIPYVLVMPNNVNEKSFLPATRSMAIRKKIFEEVGGFDVRFSHNEDYVFAKKLKKMRKKIYFSRKAIVFWLPRSTFKAAFIMFSRFAYGDIEAGIYRPKVIILFLRYLIVFILLVYSVMFYKSLISALSLFFLFMLLYCVWSIKKNFQHVRIFSGIFYLPLIQFTADFAIIYGSTKALLTLIYRERV